MPAAPGAALPPSAAPERLTASAEVFERGYLSVGRAAPDTASSGVGRASADLTDRGSQLGVRPFLK